MQRLVNANPHLLLPWHLAARLQPFQVVDLSPFCLEEGNGGMLLLIEEPGGLVVIDVRPTNEVTHRVD